MRLMLYVAVAALASQPVVSGGLWGQESPSGQNVEAIPSKAPESVDRDSGTPRAGLWLGGAVHWSFESSAGQATRDWVLVECAMSGSSAECDSSPSITSPT